MKYKHLVLAAALLAGSFTASAQLSIPSDGSDGVLNITEDTVIDLSQAVTGTWNQNNSADTGKGVYDPEKWAIVFKYSSVNIVGVGTPLQGNTVRFINHPTHAPVVWLVQGNVTINGILDLSAQNGVAGVDGLIPTEPGPGGFRGGAYGPSGAGAGYGPGGGIVTNNSAGRYATAHGNPQIIPLIGGSGSGTSGANLGRSGPAGGGAILIAASGTVTIAGKILAQGRQLSNGAPYSFVGSGGAVRIVAAAVGGAGSIDCLTDGRIRIETTTLSPTLTTSPETIGVPPANPPILWPAANAPTARVISVDSLAAPADPASPLVAAADVAIQNNNPVHILIETRNFPIEGVVQLAVIPKFNNRSLLSATRVNGDVNVATWRVTTVLPQGFVTLQARATQP